MFRYPKAHEPNTTLETPSSTSWGFSHFSPAFQAELLAEKDDPEVGVENPGWFSRTGTVGGGNPHCLRTFSTIQTVVIFVRISEAFNSSMNSSMMLGLKTAEKIPASWLPRLFREELVVDVVLSSHFSGNDGINAQVLGSH